MSRPLEKAPSPSEIRKLRGDRSRAAFGELVGVTGLTVYRWELPPEAPEARRPRGAVLKRLRAFIDEQEAPRGAAPAAPPVSSPPPRSDAIEADEQGALASALAAMDDGRLDRAEEALCTLLTSGSLRSDAARAFASVMLARLQLLARHDTKSAFATLLGVSADVTRLPRPIQLEYHLSAALLYAHSDAQLFNPGKTHHHAALAEPLLGEGRGDHRFFLWYAQYTAAVSLYEIALIARALAGLPAVRDLATSALHRCLTEEAATLSSLGLAHAADAVRQVEDFDAHARELGLPFQQTRARVWRAELAVEEAASPPRILALLDDAERLQRRHRIADGIHAMLMNRNRGETLLRLGQLRAAEDALLEATRIAHALAFTPLRIVTTRARLYLLTDRLDDFSRLTEASLASEDAQKELTRAVGRVLALLGELHRGDAASDWCERLLALLSELPRLGVWPVAYRHLALLSLAVAAPRGGLGDAERLLFAAERAVEGSASPTASATFRRHRATILLRRGRTVEARRSLEAALATFEASGDVVEATLARRALANTDQLEEKPDAEARLREVDDALAALDLRAPPLVRADAVHVDAAPPAEELPGRAAIALDQLVVPLQRLGTRGVGGALLQQELVTIVGELVPGRRVRLEQVDSAGRATELCARPGEGEAEVTWVEFSDGVGRRLRLGVGEALQGQRRAAIEIVVSAAAMAFEIAALRGFTAAPTPRAEPAVEPSSPALAELIAASPAMRRLKDELGRLSGSRATIIVTGESGTGKEVVAHAIHALSRRAAHPYVTFNSAAVPRELFEGQLFGYRRGAFTGAATDHPGVIRAADGGTLFLDEIGELPLDVQPKLLRFLENGEVLPLGERRPVQVDVRIIAATHRDLARLVREGTFREDLYYRLQVIPVHLAPLRERREDIVALARHFIRRMTPAGAEPPLLGADGEAKLLSHTWPGNVRELRNVLERAMAFEPLPRLLGAAEIPISTLVDGQGANRRGV